MRFRKLLIGIFLVFLLGLEVLIKAGNVTPFLFQILFNKNIELNHSNPDSINILLLGIGGGNHEGAKLSDTIILANVNLKNQKINLISLPRDIWIKELNGKINSAYQIGDDKKKGDGLVLAKSVVDKVTGQDPDYGAVIDFSGFVKAVDLMGGIDINVDDTFDDYQYPIDGKEADPCGHTSSEISKFTATDSAEADLPGFFPCRYIHVHFIKGMTHMSGETALEYVRSRHAQGDEGTDFARSKRQEKIIKAIFQKAVSLQILTNPAKIFSLYSTLQSSVQTDVPQNQFDDFIKLAQKFGSAKINSVVIDYGDPVTKRPGLLINPPIQSKYNYEWVLVPRTGNFDEISSYITCELTGGNCQIAPSP